MSRQTHYIRIGKSVIVSYLLWWFLWPFGAHKLYLGKSWEAFIESSLFWGGLIIIFSGLSWGVYMLVIFFIFWFVDAFRMPGIVDACNQNIDTAGPVVAVQQAQHVTLDYEAIEKLHSLYEKGILTRSQYEARRAYLLAEDAKV